jgi:hypothetical protein
VRTAILAVLRPGAIFVPTFRTLHEKSKGQLEAARFLSVAARTSGSKPLRQLSGLPDVRPGSALGPRAEVTYFNWEDPDAEWDGDPPPEFIVGGR